MLRLHGITEQEALDHSIHWVESMRASIREKHERDQKQHLFNLLVAVRLGTAAAQDEEASAAFQEVIDDLTAEDGESDTDWLVNEDAKGYDMAEIAKLGIGTPAR